VARLSLLSGDWRTGDGRRKTGDGRPETGEGRREKGDGGFLFLFTCDYFD